MTRGRFSIGDTGRASIRQVYPADETATHASSKLRDGKCLPPLGWEILAWNGILSTSTWILRIKESTSCKTANRYYEGTRIRGRHPGLARFSLIPFRPFSPTPPSSPSFRLLPLSRALHDRGWEASRTRGRGRGE